MLVSHSIGQISAALWCVRVLYSSCSLGLGVRVSSAPPKDLSMQRDFLFILFWKYMCPIISCYIKIIWLWSENMTVHRYLLVWAWIYRSYASSCVHELLIHGNHQLYIPKDVLLLPHAHRQNLHRATQVLILQRSQSCAELNICTWAERLQRQETPMFMAAAALLIVGQEWESPALFKGCNFKVIS